MQDIEKYLSEFQRLKALRGWTIVLSYLSAIGSGFLYFAAIWVVYKLGMTFIDKL